MKLQYTIAAISILASSLSFMLPDKPKNKIMTYPQTEIIPINDTFFGATVIDPYRWLEDDLDPKTKNWIGKQNENTYNYLSQIPYRETLKKNLEKIWNYERYSAPFNEGNYTYFYKNNGLQNQSILYRQNNNEEAKVFLDPNTFSKDGTSSLSDVSFTKDGSILAIQISEGGSDWRKVIVLNSATKQTIGDTLIDVKFSGISWKGNEGFFYSSYDKPSKGSELSAMTNQHKLFYHKLGTKQSEDLLIFGGSEKPRRYIGGYVTEDERFLIISAATSTNGNEVYVKDLGEIDGKITNLVADFNNNNDVVHSEGNTLYILTDMGAPNMRLVKTEYLKDKGFSEWSNVIPETKMPLSISTGAGKFFASYMKDACTQLLQYNINGTLEREIALPGKGTAGGLSGKWEENTLYYTFTSYIYPPTIFSYNVSDGASNLFKKAGVLFDPSQYESIQVFYENEIDHTKIPMMITYKKSFVMD
jgi:prolyl oligopeptidase